MTRYIDSLFRFPDDPRADREFVTSILNTATVPIVAVDRRLAVHAANLQAEEMLLRVEAEEHAKDRSARALLPPSLKRTVGSALKNRRFKIIPAQQVPGLIVETCDLLICPGRMGGVDLAFVVMLNEAWVDDGSPEGLLDRLLECFEVPMAIMDEETRYQRLNDHYLTAFAVSREEATGRSVTDRNTSKQAKIMQDQARHLMRTRQVHKGKAERLSTARKGVVVTDITVWPLYDGSGNCLGMSALARPVPVGDLEAVLSETEKDVFGTAAMFTGPPMFLTHLDGRILIVNASARALLRDRDLDNQPDAVSAIAWCNPEIVRKIYSDMNKGSDYSAILTSIETPIGPRLFRITAYGLKGIGDIISEILFHMVDVTDAEHIKGLLADTARSLATEKEILDRVIERLPVPIAYAVVDEELRILRVSTSVVKGFKLSAEHLLGKMADEIDPTTRTSGIIANIKMVIDRGQEIHVASMPYTFPGTGRELVLSLSFYPMPIEGKPACLISVQNLSEAEKQQAELGKRSRMHAALFGGVADGVVIIDLKGVIVDVNPVICRILGREREDIIGHYASEMIPLVEKDLFEDFRRRAMLMHEPLRTGTLKLTRTDTAESVFAEVIYMPSVGPDGGVEGVVGIIRFLTEIKELEQQIEEYTENLEKLVRERTQELSSANSLLATTVDRLASMARSGVILSSLKDTDSVMASFLKESTDVLGADFVSVALIESHNGTSKTTYYSSGKTPPGAEIPSRVVEDSLARLTLGDVPGEEVRQPTPNLLVVDFKFTRNHGLLLAWKREGEFTSIDSNLSRLLCTQLGFSLPITDYVADLRMERDRSQILRRIAFRVAGVSSVVEGIRLVAEELSKTIAADRFYWLVSENERDIWVREIYRTAGKPARGRRRLDVATAECFEPLLRACRDSHRQFCQKFPQLGKEELLVWPGQDEEGVCPFVIEQAGGKLSICIKGLLRSNGFLGPNGGSLVAAPVSLSERSWGMLIAYNETGSPFRAGSACFMCLAASTAGRMWEAADAASNLRRLEAAGETVSELAHDLKYPLMRMRDLASNIACCGPDKMGADPAFGGIRDEIDRLTLLTQELVDISNPGGRRYELVDVAEILSHCISLTSADSDNRSVKVTARFASELPPVFASRKDIKTVILNILANSIEAAGQSGTVVVSVGHEHSDGGPGWIRMVFEDSGPGVPEADAEKIFDPFYTSKEGGTGLGLFSAKKRAGANGGDVVCEHDESGRSRFTVRFPPASG